MQYSNDAKNKQNIIHLADKLLTDTNRKNDFVFFCRTMGLNDKQINVILNSTFKTGEVESLLNVDKYCRKTTKMHFMPGWNDIKNGSINEYINWAREKAFINNEEYKILQKFEDDLALQNVNLEQFFALNLYTDECGFEDETCSAGASYRDINYVMRFGVENFKQRARNNFLFKMKNNVFEIIALKMVNKTLKGDYEVAINSKRAIIDCVDDILALSTKSTSLSKSKIYPAQNSVWDKGNIESIVSKYKKAMDNDVYEFAKELLIDFGEKIYIAERLSDVIKSLIGYSAKTISEPVVLHRVTTVFTLRDGLGIKDSSININAKSLVGAVIQDDGFTSTSTSFPLERVEENNFKLDNLQSKVYIEILAPSGTKGVAIQSVSVFNDENEVLLNPNQMYIYDIDEDYYVEEIGIKIPKISVVLLSRDISSYPTTIMGDQKFTNEKTNHEIQAEQDNDKGFMQKVTNLQSKPVILCKSSNHAKDDRERV